MNKLTKVVDELMSYGYKETDIFMNVESGICYDLGDIIISSYEYDSIYSNYEVNCVEGEIYGDGQMLFKYIDQSELEVVKIYIHKEVHVQTLNFFKSEIHQTYKLPFTNPLEENQNDIESWFISGFITLGEYLYLCRYNRKLNKEIMTIGK